MKVTSISGPQSCEVPDIPGLTFGPTDIALNASPVPGLEHHLWMLEGSVNIEIEGTSFRVEKGDCVRYVLAGPSRFECQRKRPARYLVALVHP